MKIENYWKTLSVFCIAGVSGCPVYAQIEIQAKPPIASSAAATHASSELVSKLVKFADLDTPKLPAEKFEQNFQTKLNWKADAATGLPAVYSGSAPTYGITVTGSNRLNGSIFGQGAWMKFSPTGQCLLLEDFLPLLPNLKLHPHLGVAIFRENDPTQWEFYAAYTIESKSSYISYAFAYGINSDRIQPKDKQCLREITVTQYLR